MANYNELTEELISKLKEAAPGHILLGDDINKDYCHDEMPIYGKKDPQVVLVAHSTEEVAAVVKICNENKIPVTPRGAGTGLAGGAVPLLGGVLIDISKMNKILSYDMENFVVRVQAGVLLKDLAEDCAKHGLLYAPDPGEKSACLGGNVSTNAGGMRAVKYGATRDYVRAMTVVLPSGEITNFGASVSKTSSGYSLLNLMIGSEGTLGIITEITLKTMPAPKVAASLIIPFENLDDCIATVPKFKMEHMNPQALEFMEREIVLASERYVGKSVFPQVVDGVTANAYLLVTLDASSEDELNNLIEQASEIVLEAGAIDVLVADTPAKMKDAWAARSSFLDAIMAETKLLDECDVVVPVNKIASYLTFVNKTGEECGLTIKSFGHAGDGNLHIYQCSNDLEESEFKTRVDKFFKIIYKEATDCGGLVSGEHGIGSGKISYLADSVGNINMDLMKGIKKAFDPNYIMNPGKVCYSLDK
ncbi:2-hydroxy-acid oxidase [Clostridium carboxidivorans P7]|uniref:FAD linked oxidase domain protein n=1 Tax=Clostridium carboxidivorans P7 TaxID=536227 RepID=C6PTU6_9CLOT|nr:FAD-binding oxidoreductase [Clostridium carboxidivorans]AKN31433.1 2-hydroxy-acid oxidase [Clostridium carboxidivorans P7]EET87336.1 FAD linked oxidase domain protein [Clostridium carboxidivorans P7]EFG87176.1 putative glycolate oxidase, subunit GlcD [Clostridium carboxidivorans P7]